jgi:glycosyltransferase involved in cell wall biosynthesis
MPAVEKRTRLDDNSSVLPVLSVVVIGRNEGQRLARCLDSIAQITAVHVREVIYVDSASTDGSAELAPRHGAIAIPIHLKRPTAAVARNTGWRHAASDVILFLDGDTVLNPAFPRLAFEALSSDPSVAAVWGHRREIYPKRSIFNRVLDLDWIYPPGLTDFCGGDVLMRRAALAETGGFDDGLIAGEEPELCRRVRALGFKILHIDELMTGHDLNITKWSQYLKRAMRAGYAYAEVSSRFRNSDDAFWSSERRANVVRSGFWLLSLAAAGLASIRFGPISYALWFALLAVLSLRSSWRARWKSDDLVTLALFGVHSQLQHIPVSLGQLRYALDRLRSRRSGLIEYKAN